MRKYHIITYGCQMNKSDSERIRGLLDSFGYKEVSKSKEADLILLNTCSVRQSAEDRIFGQMKNFLYLKENKPRLLIGITGCIPGRDQDKELQKKLTGADLWFPISDLSKMPKILERATLRQSKIPPNLPLGKGGTSPFAKGGLRGISNCSSPFPKGGSRGISSYLHIKPSYQNKFQAFVPISTGCNQFCAYCVVPYARGLEKSRPLKEILEEVCYLANHGCLEVTLLGQTVNNYGAPDPKYFSKKNPYRNSSYSPLYQKRIEGDFAALLWEINQMPGILRVHFTAPHPLHMTLGVIDALTLPKQVNYLHLPVQSGDNEILKQMNRKYTREFYLDLIQKIRAKKPGIALGTDIIVGFPGETERQFQNTMDLYKKVGFDIAFIAMYSPRSGTAAYNFKNSIPQKEKKRRWQELQKTMEKITFEKNQKYIGKRVSVLIDKYKNGVCFGNSLEMKRVQFCGSKGLVGKIASVKILEAKEWILEG